MMLIGSFNLKKILYLTDLYYQAKGRNYCEEDLYITSILKDNFDVVLCHPQNSESFEENVDLIVFRNTGSVLGYKEVYDNFIQRVKKNNLNTFNDFKGKADMCGKQYLLDLTLEDYPVIPTVDSIDNLDLLPIVDSYVIKPKDGADSLGLKIVYKDELYTENLSEDMLIQPTIDFKYELSFYFLNNEYQYALYAPNPNKRWELKEYNPTKEEISFAQNFIDWNTIEKGIQRVDACKTQDNKLLLMELEDLNPYLSLFELKDDKRRNFVSKLIDTFDNLA